MGKSDARGGALASRPPLTADAATGSMRSCLAQFATGVTVVTFNAPGGPRGLTVNAFMSVSLDPPLVLVSVAKSARTHGLLRDVPFCVNVLSAEQEGLARLFASLPSEDLPRWTSPCDHEIPRLDGTIAFLECAPWRVDDAGDHSLFLGEVVHTGHRRGAALVFLANRFTTVAEPDLGVEYLI